MREGALSFIRLFTNRGMLKYSPQVSKAEDVMPNPTW